MMRLYFLEMTLIGIKGIGISAKRMMRMHFLKMTLIGRKGKGFMRKREMVKMW